MTYFAERRWNLRFAAALLAWVVCASRMQGGHCVTRVTSDGTAKRPSVSYTGSNCSWTSTTQMASAKALCQASGFEVGPHVYVSANKDPCAGDTSTDACGCAIGGWHSSSFECQLWSTSDAGELACCGAGRRPFCMCNDNGNVPDNCCADHAKSLLNAYCTGGLGCGGDFCAAGTDYPGAQHVPT